MRVFLSLSCANWIPSAPTRDGRECPLEKKKVGDVVFDNISRVSFFFTFSTSSPMTERALENLPFFSPSSQRRKHTHQSLLRARRPRVFSPLSSQRRWPPRRSPSSYARARPERQDDKEEGKFSNASVFFFSLDTQQKNFDPEPPLSKKPPQITIKLSLAADEISAPQEPPPLYVRGCFCFWGCVIERETEREKRDRKESKRKNLTLFFPFTLKKKLSFSSPSRAWATSPPSLTAPWTPSGTCSRPWRC